MPITPQTKTPVEKELDALFSNLRIATDSEEYAVTLDMIVKLHKLQADEKPQQVSPDTIVLAAVNLLGIVMILSHERLNVITTKATSLVMKPR